MRPMSKLADMMYLDVPKLANLDHSVKLPSMVKHSVDTDIANLSQTPVHVVVNVGEDKLVDKVVKGINGSSFMQGSSVINV